MGARLADGKGRGGRNQKRDVEAIVPGLEERSAVRLMALSSPGNLGNPWELQFRFCNMVIGTAAFQGGRL